MVVNEDQVAFAVHFRHPLAVRRREHFQAVKTTQLVVPHGLQRRPVKVGGDGVQRGPQGFPPKPFHRALGRPAQKHRRSVVLRLEPLLDLI